MNDDGLSLLEERVQPTWRVPSPRQPDAAHEQVLAGLADEEVLGQRRKDRSVGAGGVQLGHPDTVPRAGAARDTSTRRRVGCPARPRRSVAGRWRCRSCPARVGSVAAARRRGRRSPSTVRSQPASKSTRVAGNRSDEGEVDDVRLTAALVVGDRPSGASGLVAGTWTASRGVNDVGVETTRRRSNVPPLSRSVQSMNRTSPESKARVAAVNAIGAGGHVEDVARDPDLVARRAGCRDSRAAGPGM